MISNASLAFNSLMGGLTFGVGNGIMAKISGRNFWSGRPQQYCGPDMDMLPQKVVTEPESLGSGKNMTAPEISQPNAEFHYQNNTLTCPEGELSRLSRYEGHVFSAQHVRDGIYEALGTTNKTEGMQRIYNAIRMADSQGLIVEGNNQMMITVGEYQVGIRANVYNGTIRSLDAFTITSSPENLRNMGNIFYYEGPCPWTLP